MGQALPIDLLVEITSSGVKDTFTLGKLPTLLITKANKDVPNPEFSTFSSLSAVKEAFKQGSVVDFASEYFGFISKSGTKCDSLSVYNWRNADEPAMLKGGVAPTLTALKALNGALKLTIDGESHDVELDLTNANSLSEVASLIQVAISSVGDATDSFKNSECIFNSQTDGFIITSAKKGNGATIFYAQSPDNTNDKTDIHDKLGLTESEGASVTDGISGVSFADALSAIESNNGNYAIITTDFEFDSLDSASDLKTFGQFIKASNFRFAGIYSDGKLLNADLEDRLGDDGIIADLKVADNQNGLVAAYISSMDLGKAGGNINVAFNDASGFSSKAITSPSVFEMMKAKKLNAPCKFGVLGQDDTIYMTGDCWGTTTNSINVYVGNMYLKFAQQIALFNLFKSSKIIGLRDVDSKNAIYGYIAEVFEDGVSAGIVVAGAELTTTEKNVLSQNFGALVDDIQDVYDKVSQNGYFFIVNSIDLTKREMNITECYVANLPTQKIVINNFILGA